MFEVKFTPCLQIYLYHVYRHVYTMLDPYLKICLIYARGHVQICLLNIRGYVCNMFRDKLKPCLKTHLHHVYIYVCQLLVSIVALFKVGFLNYMTVYCFHLTWHQHGLNSENLRAQHWVDAAENSHRHIGLVTRYFIRENFLKNNL